MKSSIHPPKGSLQQYISGKIEVKNEFRIANKDFYLLSIKNIPLFANLLKYKYF